MSQPLIQVDGLGKMYRIGGVLNRRHRHIREVIVSMLKAPWRRLQRLSEHGGDLETFWALRDLSFDVNQGEVLGVVGSNGAGKSTLLKILSRITSPTEGEITYRGRIASLLEVGTGFHPELTGRENIFLNGSILGMRRFEIKRQFDEIVQFAGVENFLETPVKRYSSGMYVRLAFAVAAHLEPEILLIDEVLAVGDVAFQQRCLKKMNDVARKDGRTVLFVSHNLAAVRQLCPRSILLEGGRLTMDAPTPQVLNRYLGGLVEGATAAFTENPNRSGDGDIRVIDGALRNSEGKPTSKFMGGETLVIDCNYEAARSHSPIHISAQICDQAGAVMTELSTWYTGTPFLDLGKRGSFQCTLPSIPLLPGQYRVAVTIRANRRVQDQVPNAFVFDVIGSHFFPSSRVPEQGVCMVDHEWSANPQEATGQFALRSKR